VVLGVVQILRFRRKARRAQLTQSRVVTNL